MNYFTDKLIEISGLKTFLRKSMIHFGDLMKYTINMGTQAI